MGFSLIVVAMLVGLAALYVSVIPIAWRQWTLCILSVVLIYIFQPRIKVRWVDFFLPTLTIGITVLGWLITRPTTDPLSSLAPIDKRAMLVILALVIGLSLLRFVPSSMRWLVASKPPPLLHVILFLSVCAVMIALINRSSQKFAITILVIIGLFLILKAEMVAVYTSSLLRQLTQQDVSLASSVDLRWIGFSYIAFRIIHTIRDRQSGLLPDTHLRDYLTYVLFFPSLPAGPIDRLERFQTDFQALSDIQLPARWVVGLSRIGMGVFKKFILADLLVQGLVVSPSNADQIQHVWGAWLLLYGYALMLFFDFSGYSDIAIGIGQLFGIALPENFKRPYLQQSITKFWQSWHITLSNWVRFYIFSPLSRHLLKRKPKPSALLVVFIGQLVTMVVIGLWHGITINFLIWGLWHGWGLFIHKVWTDRTRQFYRQLKQRSILQQRLAAFCAWLITFHYVVLGWVWFALPTTEQALRYFRHLFGF